MPKADNVKPIIARKSFAAFVDGEVVSSQALLHPIKRGPGQTWCSKAARPERRLEIGKSQSGNHF